MRRESITAPVFSWYRQLLDLGGTTEQRNVGEEPKLAESEASSIVYRAPVYRGNANVRFVQSGPYYEKTEFA